jgi:hypothetical protein
VIARCAATSVGRATLCGAAESDFALPGQYRRDANFYKTSAATESANNLPAGVRKTRLSFRASNPSLINLSA